MSYYGGFGCCVGAALFYLLSKSYKGEVEFLKSVTRVSSIKELRDLLETACNAVVTLTGSIDTDTPIQCKYTKKEAVSLKEWVEQPYRKRCKKCEDNKWKDGSSISKGVRSEYVPWYLRDGTGRVNLVNVHSATGFGYGLYRSSKIVEKPDFSLVQKIEDECSKCGEYLKIKILDSNRYERILPVGTSLTVIGEAVKDKKGAIKIQTTQNGSFYASQTSIDKCIEEAESGESTNKRVAIVFAGIGVILIALPTIRYIIGKTRAWLLPQRRIEHAPAPRNNVIPAPPPVHNPRNYDVAPVPILNPENNLPVASAPILNVENDVPAASALILNPENDVPAASALILNPENDVPATSASAPLLPDNAEEHLVLDACVVCHDLEYSMVFVPCGHLCCCMTCSSILTECPICRQNISQAVRTYRP